MTYTKNERENYNDHRDHACDTLMITKNQYNYLRRLANELSKVDVDYCNGDIDDETIYDIKTDDVLDRMGAYLHKIRPYAEIYHQSDPRGASLYISNDEKMTQANYNSVGVCIY